MHDTVLAIIEAELTKKEGNPFYDYLYKSRPQPNKVFSLVIFAAFILAIAFYYQYNLLVAFIVFLLFIVWYLNSDLNIFAKRYKKVHLQKVFCYNDAQNFILRTNYKKAYDSLLHYTNRYNDPEAMVLYQITLFFNEKYDIYLENIPYCLTIDNDGLKLLNGIVHYYTNNYNEAKLVLSDINNLSENLELLRLTFLALTNLHDQNIMEDYTGRIKQLPLSHTESIANRMALLNLIDNEFKSQNTEKEDN